MDNTWFVVNTDGIQIKIQSDRDLSVSQLNIEAIKVLIRHIDIKSYSEEDPINYGLNIDNDLESIISEIYAVAKSIGWM